MPARRAYPAAFRRKRTKRRINGKPPTASPGAGSLAFIPLSSHHLPSYFIYYTIILPFVNRDLPKSRDFFVNCISSLPKTENGGEKNRVSARRSFRKRAAPRFSAKNYALRSDRPEARQSPALPAGCAPAPSLCVFTARQRAPVSAGARCRDIYISVESVSAKLPGYISGYPRFSGVCGVSSRL